MWRVFSKSMADVPHPLDTWTEAVISPIADDFGATAAFPFEGPPYHPFQRWALAADDVSPSPIGPLIHPLYGMWHAYRAAFLFTDRLEIPVTTEKTPSPCISCRNKPCLNTCPVGAFTAEGYDVPGCRAHIGSPGGETCLSAGCLARRACPVGQDYIYEGPQAAFHMDKFLNAD
ncbi:MAG: ferredoxin [Rhodospirillales bacterium]|nr:ferredoxin [Rhodospirillales bacterium]